MLSELHSILNLLEGGFSQLKALVIGELMLDSYIHGEVERISPEALVPVLGHAQRYERAGGAAKHRDEPRRPGLPDVSERFLGQRL